LSGYFHFETCLAMFVRNATTTQYRTQVSTGEHRWAHSPPPRLALQQARQTLCGPLRKKFGDHWCIQYICVVELHFNPIIHVFFLFSKFNLCFLKGPMDFVFRGPSWIICALNFNPKKIKKNIYICIYIVQTCIYVKGSAVSDLGDPIRRIEI